MLSLMPFGSHLVSRVFAILHALLISGSWVRDVTVNDEVDLLSMGRSSELWLCLTVLSLLYSVRHKVHRTLVCMVSQTI